MRVSTREMPGTELVGIVDILPDRAAEIAQAYRTQSWTDYRELFGKVDAVSLAVPTTDHARIGVDLLQNGIDILVEKPIATTRDEARLLIDTAARHGRILQTGHVERFNPVVTAAIEVGDRTSVFRDPPACGVHSAQPGYRCRA